MHCILNIPLLLLLLLITFTYAQAPGSIEDAIELANRGVGYVVTPYGFQTPSGIVFPEGYTGWITLPKTGGPPCKAANEYDLVGQC